MRRGFSPESHLGQILALFKAGRPVTCDEVRAVTRNATARISDLRNFGYNIRLVGRDWLTGVTHYRFFVNGKPGRFK